MDRGVLSLAVVLVTLVLLRLTGDPKPVVVSVSPEVAALRDSTVVIDGHNDVAHWVAEYGFDLSMDGGQPSKSNAEWYWVLDGVLPRPTGSQLRTHTDLARLGRGGVDAQFFSIFSDPSVYAQPAAAEQRAHFVIDRLNNQFEQSGNKIALACSPAEIGNLTDNGQIAALYGLEGAHAVTDFHDSLERYHERGVRYITLTWANSNAWADSGDDVVLHGGLSEDGEKLVSRMNALGILIDVSHASDDTFWDVVDHSTAPIIASHSSARALVDRARNLSDEMLEAIARSGGIAMVNFGGIAIDPRKATTAQQVYDVFRHWGFSDPDIGLVADHIEHMVRVAGIDHVGLGSDFDGTLFLPAGLKSVADFPRLTQTLVDRGFSDEVIVKLLGGNFMRVFRDAQEGAADGVRHTCKR